MSRKEPLRTNTAEILPSHRRTPSHRLWKPARVRAIKCYCAIGAMLAALILTSPEVTADERLSNRPISSAPVSNSPVSNSAVFSSAASRSLGKSVGQGDRLILKFKVSPTVDSQVVRLGDLIDVVSWGARAQEDLLHVPLGPAPQVGNYQDWTANDLMRNLELRGLDKGKMAWHGPETVRLMRQRTQAVAQQAAAFEPKKLAPAFLNDRMISQAEDNLIQATREYLWLQTNERTQWRISLKMPAELAGTLAQKRNVLSIGGGAEPWTGPQRLVYLIKHQGEEFELSMTVDVGLPTTVVVANRAIRRDEVIDESCLSYAAIPERLEEQADQYFADMSDLVGKQMRRAMSTGVPIPRASIGEPNVISSGEILEIESVSGGVVVKSAAKALGGGAVGELINVELIPSRKRLAATVVGPMLVRITGKSTVRSAPLEPEAIESTPAPNRTAGKFQARGDLR